MSDRTYAARAGRPPRRRWLTQPANLTVIVIACVIAIIVILVGGHFYGRYLSARDLGGRDNVIQQLRAESQKIKRQLDAESAQRSTLETKLKDTQATLTAILPKANTYNIEPNQSLALAGGRLNVGLVGAPGTDNIVLNINGKDQTLGAGQTVSVTPDPATTCQVQVQSFDMFRAVLVATCKAANAATKAQ